MRVLLKILLWNFNIIGVNPLNRGLIPNILCLLTYSTTFILFMANLLVIVLNWQGMDSLDDINMLPLILVFPAKLSNIALKKEKFYKMVKKIETFWPEDKFGKDAENTIRNLHRMALKLVITFTVIFWGLASVHVGVPLALHEKALFYPGNYLCNLTTTPCFEIVYSWQLTALLFQIIPTILGYECLFICFVDEAYCAMEMVKIALKRFKSADEDAKSNIGEIVNQHVIVLSFIDDMREFYNETLLLQFWSSLGAMVFGLFMLTSEGIPPPGGLFVQYGGTFYFLAVQLLIYCLGGSLVLEQSLTISEEAYFVDWWAKTSVRNDLALIIERSQKGSKLLVGNMSTLNLEQFLTVIRNAFSVYGLLMTIEDKGSDTSN